MKAINDPGEPKTRLNFIGTLVWDLASAGNSFHVRVPGPRGAVHGFRRLDPLRVEVLQLSDRSINFRYIAPGGIEEMFVQEEIWHLRANPIDEFGLLGMSPIWVGRKAIHAGLALQEYTSKFFENDCTPPFVLKHPGNFDTVEDRNNYMNAIREWWGGNRQHSPGILEHSIDLQKVGNSNEESQFLETTRESNKNIIRIWNMQPHIVGIMDDATFSNIEHQGLEFVSQVL